MVAAGGSLLEDGGIGEVSSKVPGDESPEVGLAAV
jgi:hypothetical protein